MIIAIDGNEANVEQLVGVSVYTLKLLENFKEKANSNLKFLIFLKYPPLNHMPQESKFFKYKVIKGPLWSQITLPFYLLTQIFKKEKIDVFFSPAHYSPRFLPFKSVVTIHDLSYFYFPEEFLKKDLYKLKNWTSYSVKRARKVIAVSKTTKKDLIKFYNLPSEKITVIYNGWEKKKVKPKRPDIKNLKEKNFILFVSTIQPRKNIVRLAKAFDKFKKETNSNLKLVIAGKKGWLWKKIFDEIEKLETKNEIIFTEYLSEENLAWLYKNALFFVHPSLYEGFGLPILEAFSYNLPVACSFTGALPEIAGDSALYFDPENIDEIKEKIKKLADDKELRKNLAKKGKERLKNFSWRKCAEETLEVLTSLK